MNSNNPWLSCATIVFSCVIAAGCKSNEKDDSARDKDFERIARSEPQAGDRDVGSKPDQVIARDRDRVDDRAGDRRPGLKEIPTDAQAVDTAEGAKLDYEPTRDGVVYVYDADNDRVIYVARVRERERFRLDPEGDRALINSKIVLRSDLNPRHRYRLYFDAAR